MSVEVVLELPDDLFSALRRTPEAFVSEMRLPAIRHLRERAFQQPDRFLENSAGLAHFQPETMKLVVAITATDTEIVPSPGNLVDRRNLFVR